MTVRKNAKRLMVDEPVKEGMYRVSFSPYEFEGTLEEVADRFIALREKYKGRAIRIDWDYAPYSDDREFRLLEKRPETDEEYEARTGEEAKRKQMRREQDLETLERLRKEYPEQFK